MNNYSLLIGNFDGVHQGHAQYVQYALNESRKRSLKLLIVTFEPHPALYFSEYKNFLITSLLQKKRLLFSLGNIELEVVSFDKSVAQLSGEDFFQQLFQRFSVKLIFAGHDFSIGRDRKFQTENLQNLASSFGVEVLVAPIYYFEGQRISSTLIRSYLVNGQIELANDLLGHSFSYCQNVVRGDQIGRQIGFPTANFVIDEKRVVPKFGVYKTKTKLDGREYHSVTNVGVRPTVKSSDSQVLVETHILDFNEEIYGKEIEVKFLKFVRDEKKFSGLSELKAQIDRDISDIKNEL